MSFWEDLTMTVRELCNTAGFTPLALPDPDREIEGCYVGDLLSWVMGNATYGCAWITIMTNRNIIAVATLIDMACILLAEGCTLPEDLTELAMSQNVNVLTSGKPAYETCAALATLL